MSGIKGRSGRKKAASPKKRYNVTISPEVRKLYLKRYGNLSKGIEKLAMEFLQESEK